MGLISHAITFSLLILLAASNFVANADQHSAPHPSTAPAPTPHHHGHHHHHHHYPHPPSPAPAKPPISTTPPPSKPPTPPPSKPPTTPPAKPPTHPTPRPPTPPAKPPTHPTPPPSPPPAKPPPAKPPTNPTPPPPTPPRSPPPAKPPTYPSHPPSKPPTSPPTKPPTPYHPLPRKLVAVQGVVYCKNCSYVGVDTLLGASPLAGARVVLRCRNTKYLIRQTATTDKNGYFFMQAPPLITTYGARRCRVSLASGRHVVGTCSKPTNLHGGVTGAPLVLDRKALGAPLPFTLFTVGPFAYEPPKCIKH